MTAPQPTDGCVQRVLPAPPEDVYNEWVDPQALRDWMCPRPARPTKVEVEPVVGGRLRIDIHDDGADFYVSGTYVEVDPPHKLSFTWSCSTWDDPTVQSIVTVTLQPHGDASTLMTINHELLPPATIENHTRGWAAIGDQLATRLLERNRLFSTDVGDS